MKRIFLLLPFLILFHENTFSQEIESVWISSHIRTIKNNNQKNINKAPNNGNTSFEEEIVEEEIDTSINFASGALDFINSKEVVLVGIGRKIITGKYKVRKNKISIKSEKGKLKGRIENEKIILGIGKNKYRKEEIIFEKIINSELKVENIPDSSDFYNSHWKVISDTSSIYHGLNFHFLDSNNVIITKHNDKYGVTNWGMFNVDNYKNHLFLSIANRNFGENYLFNIYRQQNQIYFANSYEVKLFTYSPPPLVNLQLEKIPLIANSEIDSIKGKLIGSWLAINDAIPSETSKYNLENQYLEIEFENHKFRIIKGGNLNYGDRIVPKEVTIKGNWELSPTGQYIILNPDDSWTEYVSINQLKMDYAEFYLSIKAIEAQYFQSKNVKFKKNYKP